MSKNSGTASVFDDETNTWVRLTFSVGGKGNLLVEFEDFDSEEEALEA